MTNWSDGYLIAAMLFAGFSLAPLAVIVHEAGHATMAALMGCPIILVKVGAGPLWVARRFFGVKVGLGRYLVVSGLARHARPFGRGARWRLAAILMSGSLANLLLGGLFAVACVASGRAPAFPAQMSAAVFSGLAASNLLLGIGNLVPTRLRASEVGRTDGLQLVDLMLRWREPGPDDRRVTEVWVAMQLGRFDEAAALASEARAEGPYRGYFLNSAIRALSRSEGDRAAHDFFRRHANEAAALLKSTDSNDGENGFALKINAVWSALKLDQGLLGEGMPTFVIGALKAKPDAVEVMGTCGAWMLGVGRLDEGMGLLTRAVREAEDLIDRADFCLFLAKGMEARGDTQMAHGFGALRIHFLKQASA